MSKNMFSNSRHSHMRENVIGQQKESRGSKISNWRSRNVTKTTTEEEEVRKKVWVPAPPVKKSVWGSVSKSTQPILETTTTSSSSSVPSSRKKNVWKKQSPPAAPRVEKNKDTWFPKNDSSGGVKTVWGRPVNTSTTMTKEKNSKDSKKRFGSPFDASIVTSENKKNLTKKQRKEKIKAKTIKKSINKLFDQAKRVKDGSKNSDHRLPAAIKVTKTFSENPKAFEHAMRDLKRYRRHVLGPKSENKKVSSTPSTTLKDKQKRRRKKMSTLKKRVLDERLRVWKEHTGKDYNDNDDVDEQPTDLGVVDNVTDEEKKEKEEEEKVVVVERRVDPADGNAYTKEEFIQAYGGLKEWDLASNEVSQGQNAPLNQFSSISTSLEEERRVDPSDGNLYTKNEFVQAYGGLKEWDMAAESQGIPTISSVKEEEEEEELRIDPNDGKAYNKAEFQFEYGGLTEWNSAKIATVVKKSVDPFGLSKENGRYVKSILCKDNVTRYVVYWNNLSFKSEDRTRNRRFDTMDDAHTFFHTYASKMRTKIERRIDTNDNLAYTLEDFLVAYGEEQGQSKWNDSKVFVDPEDEKLFTLVKQKRKRPIKVPRLQRDARNGKMVREYVTHELSPELDKAITKLIQVVYYNNERQKLKDFVVANENIKKKKRRKRAKREPRILLGFREVKRSARHGELQCVVIAPDIEVVRNEGGLDDTVNAIIDHCKSHDIPVFFSMSRRRLAKTILRHVRVSVVGIVNAEGAHSYLRESNAMLRDLELRWKLREKALPTIEIADGVTREVGKFATELMKEMDLLLKEIGPVVKKKKKKEEGDKGSRKKKLSSSAKEFVPRSVALTQQYYLAHYGTGTI